MKPKPAANHTSIASTAILDNVRLRLLKLLLTCGSVAIMLIWLLETWSDRVVQLDRLAYPAMLAIFAASLVTLYLRPLMLRKIERLSFGTFAVYVVLHALPIELAGGNSYTDASLAQWFPLVYTAAFFFLETHQAIAVSIVLYAAVIGPNLAARLLQDSSSWPSDQWLLLLNVALSHPVYIVTLSGIANLKAKLVQAKAHADVMSAAANIDYLTGIPNRRSAVHALQEQLRKAQIAGQTLSVILFDIDHFKRINDTFGHDVGDQVLIGVAETLVEHVRVSDQIGRWGGEEFIIVATATAIDDATVLAERLRTTIAQQQYPQAGHITSSFGVATSTRRDTPESLVKRADEALYQAKQHGRNQVEVAAASTSA